MSDHATVARGADDPFVIALAEAVRGEVRAGAPLADRTTLKVGGPARALVVAHTPEDLQAVGTIVGEWGLRWLVLGRGSNLLVADRGVDGAVVVLGRGFRGVDVGEPDEPSGAVPVDIGAAEPMPVLANKLEAAGLGGMAFAVAIPGAVGGAVKMNAGAHGGQMADVLEWADVVHLTDGRGHRWHAADLRMRYRHTDLPDDAVVTTARVRLRPSPADQLAADMAEMRQWRRDHQPINQPSCGSVFRNPEGDSAGRLIDACGLKGYRVGGAEVSRKHANFITVTPGARAADVHAIIRHVHDEVARNLGVDLEPEVVIVGFDDGGGGGR